MAKQKPTPANPPSAPDLTWGGLTPEQREAMIRDSAYFFYANRGYAPGYDFDDWLAAEAEVKSRMAEPPEFPPDTEVHQSSVHGARMDDELKRIARQHPQKGIPQVEGIDPENAPFKE